MAKSIELTVKQRSELGSRANKRLRDSGLLPGVIYGHKEAVVPITLSRKETVSHLDKGARVFDLRLEDRTEKVLIKEVQYDHLGLEVIHADFARVSLDETVDITVPVELKGEPKGEADGGVLQQIIAELEVECRVTEIPDVIRHIVTDMALNDVLRIKDLKLPEGVRCLLDGELIVAQVKEVVEEATTEAAVEGASGTEPEVIGKKPAEGEEAAEGAAAGEKEKK